MNARVALKSVMAFTVALVAGHFLFSGLARHRASLAPSANVAKSDTSNGMTATTVNHANEVSSVVPPFAPGRPINNINRDFEKVATGFKNKNSRMSTVFSNVYLGGMEFTAPHRNKTIGWKPSGQEVRQGDKVVAVAAMASASEAHVEQHPESRHLVYPATYADTDEHLYVRPEGGVEHDIILKKQPAISEGYGLAYTGYLTVGEGLTIWDDKVQIVENFTTKHGLFFKDRLGNSVFYLHDPIAYDADVTKVGGGLDIDKQGIPQNQKHATGCEYQLTFDATGIKLAIVTPGKWLLEPDRAYPVTIDPTIGPFGLADGNPPIYTGAVGTGVLVPLYSGGTKLKIEEQCTQLNKLDNGYGHIPMPFDFDYYVGHGGRTFHGPNSPTGQPQDNLFVHIDGWVSWDPPAFKYCDEIPCDPLESACFDNPSNVNGNGVIPNGAYPTDGAVYALWNDLRFSNDPTSGIYYLVDGVQPSRRLIIEWQRMGYVGGLPTDSISFNIILYECQSVIEIIVGDVTNGNNYHGTSTIGIESPGDAFAVVYDTFSPPALGDPDSTELTGLDLQFSVSPFGMITDTVTNNVGCIPLNVNFSATVMTTVPACELANGGQPPIPPAYSFHWTFGDGGEAFTANVSHLYVLPNNYNQIGLNNPTLTVTDAFGTSATFTNLTVDACDIPPVVITVNPLGGPAPLTVDVKAISTSPFVPKGPPDYQSTNGSPLVPSIDSYLPATTAIQIDLLDPQNFPGQSAPYQTLTGGTVTTVPVMHNNVATTTMVDTIESQVTFDTPGTYRLQTVFPSLSFTLPSTGTGTVYIDVTDPNSSVSNSMIITQSNFKINWAGKILNTLGFAPKPSSDTIAVSGYLNLTGLDLSTLTGQTVTLALNAYTPIFQGVLDSNGKATQGDASTGQTGSFAVSLPSGKFTCSVTGDFATSLNLTSQNLISLLTAHYRVQIGNVFNSGGTSVTYGYSSLAGKQASGNYTFGKYFNKGTFYNGGIPGAPPGTGKPGGQELLISGGFLVTAADFKLQGDTVSASISGLMARAGGDDLRPAASSDVIIKIGNLSETLNFSTTPTFKTTGKPPAQKFTFKSKGGTNIKTLTWINKQGGFSLTTFNLSNAQVGIDPQKGRQSISLTFTVTPENSVQFIGTTTFDIIKVSDTEFKH